MPNSIPAYLLQRQSTVIRKAAMSCCAVVAHLLQPLRLGVLKSWMHPDLGKDL